LSGFDDCAGCGHFGLLPTPLSVDKLTKSPLVHSSSFRQRLLAMTRARSPQQVLDDELLPLRAKLLEVAAVLDRMDRGQGPPPAAQTISTIRAAVETLLRGDPNRTEQIQLLFSRPYADNWRAALDV
jgi:hypothetical protein